MEPKKIDFVVEEENGFQSAIYEAEVEARYGGIFISAIRDREGNKITFLSLDTWRSMTISHNREIQTNASSRPGQPERD